MQNIFIVYIKRSLVALHYRLKNRGKKLRIGSAVSLNRCNFGQYNTICKNTKLINTTLGDFTYIGDDSQLTNTEIGKFCSVSSGVRCGLGMHPARDFVSTHPVFFSTQKQAGTTFVEKNYFDEYKKTEIGNDVWIGANAIILDGIKINDGAIIGAGAVVSKDVEPYAIVGGIPAKLIRYRFDPEKIDVLLKIGWWNKDIIWIKKHHHLFRDINKFISFFKKR